MVRGIRKDTAAGYDVPSDVTPAPLERQKLMTCSGKTWRPNVELITGNLDSNSEIHDVSTV